MKIQGFPVYCAGGTLEDNNGNHKELPALCKTCDLLGRPLNKVTHNIKPSWRIKDKTLYNRITKSCPLYKQKENE